MLDAQLFQNPTLLGSTEDRPLSDKDCESICELLQVLSPESAPSTHDYIRQAIGDASTGIMVVIRTKEDDRIVAMATMHFVYMLRGLCGLVHEVVVHPDFKRRGLARSMMEFLEHEARMSEVTHIDLTSSRSDAKRMYDILGYTRRDTAMFRKTM